MSSAQAFTNQNRLWISGDKGLYTSDMQQLHNQLTAAFVLHTWVAGGYRAHSWNSGRLDGAVTALDAIPTPMASPPACGRRALRKPPPASIRIRTPPAVLRPLPVSPYASMPYVFATNGGTSHSTLVISLTNGAIYSFFVRCKDSRGNWNPNDFSIAFSVATPCDTNPPVRSNGQPTGVLATVMTNLSLATDENATCRYATVAGTDYASMVNTFSITGHGWDGPLHCGQRAREWRELQLTCGVRTPRQRQPRRLCDHLLGGGACRPVVE